MEKMINRGRIMVGALGLGLSLAVLLRAQEGPPLETKPVQVNQAPDAPPLVPRGVEVLARGPVHEAFASPSTIPEPTKAVAKKPPKPIEELPPEEKPEGAMIWIGGYWHWDDDRNDFLWVSGIWRATPPGKQWIAGYWKENSEQWQWVPGFWVAAEQQGTAPGAEAKQQVTYLPQPPAPPETAPPGAAPGADSFYVPGHWVWAGTSYAWRAGYWARVQPGYVWVSSHYRWTPSGYVFISGYWDLAIARRGVLYAPVAVDVELVGPTFVYTPTYVVRETVVVDSFWVRPSHCHYYFGDYYGVTYSNMGFESCVVYSRLHYEPIIVYERWDHRDDPRWESVHVDIYLARNSGRLPLPPRTLVQQNVIVQNNVTNVTNVTNVNNVNNVNNVTNNQMLTTTRAAAASKGVATVPVAPAARAEAQQQAQSIRQVASQRIQTESVAAASGPPTQPRTSSLSVPVAKPIGASAAASTSGGASVSKATQGTTTSNTAGGKTATGTAGAGGAAGKTSSTNPTAGTSRPTTPGPGPAGSTVGPTGVTGQPGTAGTTPVAPGIRPPMGPNKQPPPPPKRPPPRDDKKKSQ